MKRAKPIENRLRDADQIPTRPTTVAEIMADPAFGRGVEDVRAGRGYPSDYDLWSNTNSRWAYERGRHWATLAPRRLKLKEADGRISVEALWFYVKHGDEIL